MPIPFAFHVPISIRACDGIEKSTEFKSPYSSRSIFCEEGGVGVPVAFGVGTGTGMGFGVKVARGGGGGVGVPVGVGVAFALSDLNGGIGVTGGSSPGHSPSQPHALRRCPLGSLYLSGLLST